MASPVSVGDVVLLARTAYAVGQALTSGRKSAPSEFAEVKDLLNTLGNALKLVARELPDPNNKQENENEQQNRDSKTIVQEDVELLSDMMKSCERTLTHLQKLVKTYEIIGPQNNPASGHKRLRDELWKNWKKVVWTKEGGDVVKLKTTLTAHINGINLAVGAIGINQSRSANDKLTQIYDWFLANNVLTKTIKADQTSAETTSVETVATPSTFTSRPMFTVSIVDDNHETVLCPRATFTSNWLETNTSNGSGVFECCCPQNSHSLFFSLLPVSLLARLVISDLHQNSQLKGPFYQIFLASPISNQPVKVTLSNISHALTSSVTASTSDLSTARTLTNDRDWLIQDRHETIDFLRYVDALAGAQEYVYRQSRLNTYLISASEDSGLSRVLFAKADSDLLTCLISRVSFVAHAGSFDLTAVERVQLLHYRSHVEQSSNQQLPFLTYPSAILVIDCTSPDNSGQGPTYEIELTRGLTISTHTTHVNLANTTCRAISNAASLAETLECSVELGLRSNGFGRDTGVNSAAHLTDLLRAFQRHLLRAYLQGPLVGEHVVFTRYVGTTLINDVLLTFATMRVILDGRSGKHRLVLCSWDSSVSVTLELVNAVLDGQEGHITQLNGNTQEAWFVCETKDELEIWRQSIQFNFSLA